MRSIKGRGGLTRGRGMHETVRTVWVNTMTECAQMHVAMSRLTDLCRSEVDHVEVSASRIRRDVSDLHKVITYLCQNSPFRFSDEDKLISLSSGVVADETVNCDNADEIGFEIQSRWDNKKFGR